MDKSYNSAIAASDKALTRILAKWAFLDDAQEIIKRDPISLRKAVREFVFALGKIISGVNSNVLLRTIIQEQADIQKKLSKYPAFKNFKTSQARASTALSAIVRDQSANARTILASMSQRLNAKNTNLLMQAVAMGMPREIADEQLDRRLIKINFIYKGKDLTVAGVDLKKVWETLDTRYGNHSTITYRDGKNYPVQSYVEGKGKTISREVQNTVTAVEAGATGSAVGQFESYGAGDSCVIWEGKFFFFTEGGKRQFLRKFGNKYPDAYTWPTYADVHADRTHMASYNCRHKTYVVPLEHLDPEDLGEAEIGKAPKIPKTNKGIEDLTAALI